MRNKGLADMVDGLGDPRPDRDAIAAAGEAANVSVLEDSVAGRAGPLTVRRYCPAGRSGAAAHPAILFMHGGRNRCAEDSPHAACRGLAQATGVQVVAVDYRQPPLLGLAAAAEDCADAHAMMVDRSTAWGIDSRRIAVAGAGVGASLACIVAIRARDLFRPLPVAQLLFLCAASQPPGDASSIWDWSAAIASLTATPPTFAAVPEQADAAHPGLAYLRRMRDERLPLELRTFARAAPQHGLPADLAPAGAFLKARLAALDFATG